MSGDDKMLERVRRLLSKAEGAATESERDAYNAKAAELIARYGIAEALLRAKAATGARPADRIVILDAPYARDKASLLSAVAIPLGVQGVLCSQRTAHGTQLSMHLFGMSADLERVDVLYTSLLVQAAHGLAVARPADAYESVAAYRRSWMLGFAYTIQSRLITAEQAAAERAEADHRSQSDGGPSVSLVLADRATMVQQAMSEAYPRLRSAPTRYLSGTGHAAGAAAARRADLGGTRLGRRSRPALR